MDAVGTIAIDRTREQFLLRQWLYNIADHHTIGWYHWFLPSKDEFVFDHMNGGYFSNVRDDDKVEGRIRRALAEMKDAAAEEVAASPKAAAGEEEVASPSRAGS